MRSFLLKSGIVVVLICAFAVAASAYTLVFRNGNRMEIPDEFKVTRTTLTYEMAPGFQKTILVSLIDIGATERANNEPWGSFFKRSQIAQQRAQAQQTPQPSEPAPQATKTVTNSDLAAIRQRRLESEQAYEQRRLQLGLPTVAETRMRQQEDERLFRSGLLDRAAATSREESFWRGRARELRTEIATVDNQLNYVRARLNEINESSRVTGSVTQVYPSWPDYRPWSRDRWGRRNRRQTTPPIFGPPQNPYGYPNGQYPNGYPPGQNPYGYPQGQYPYGYPGQNPYGYPNQNPYGYPGQGPYGYPNQNPYGYPTSPYDADKSMQHADLTRRLDDLLMRRAGLMAQWQALEGEARDARVPQIWLEP
ncbi:MAG TPA: hypothetical protein VGW32_05820 [Pyrinomonadaceae bacterium]|nr:hypothetical protein [Pyrinomonadaceae bacterium]